MQIKLKWLVILIYCCLHVSGREVVLNDTTPARSYTAIHCNRLKDGYKSWYQFCKDAQMECIHNEEGDGPTCKCKTDEIFIKDIELCIPSKCITETVKGETWYEHCKRAKATCILKEDNLPSCECKEEEIVHLIEEKCFSIKCISEKVEGETWYDLCKTADLSCILKEDNLPSSECKEEETFHVKDKKCVYFCANGNKGEEECDRVNRICRSLKTYPFYKCTECKDGYTEKEDKCLGYCTNGTKAKEQCDQHNRVCRSLEHHPFYKCDECKDGYINDGNTCKDYCASGQEGRQTCDEERRTCEPIRTSPYFLCKECQKGFEENKNICIRVCERNSTSAAKCKEMNRKCEYIGDFPFYHCGECEEGLKELEGLCVRRKDSKEINPFQLLVIKSMKTAKEKKLILYKPRSDSTSFDFSSLLDLK